LFKPSGLYETALKRAFSAGEKERVFKIFIEDILDYSSFELTSEITAMILDSFPFPTHVDSCSYEHLMVINIYKY
jgi:hypothetical protein